MIFSHINIYNLIFFLDIHILDIVLTSLEC